MTRQAVVVGGFVNETGNGESAVLGSFLNQTQTIASVAATTRGPTASCHVFQEYLSVAATTTMPQATVEASSGFARIVATTLAPVAMANAYEGAAGHIAATLQKPTATVTTATGEALAIKATTLTPNPNYWHVAAKTLAPTATSHATLSAIAPNDPGFVDAGWPTVGQWALFDSYFNVAWQAGYRGSSSVIIADLNYGSYSFSDLSANLLTQWNATTQASDTHTDYGGSGDPHGTAVATLISGVANNSLDLAGASFNCSLLPIAVVTSSLNSTDAYLATGLTYAVSAGAKVINMSIGGYGTSTVLQDALEAASEAGCFIAAACGDNGSNINATSPAAFCIMPGVPLWSANQTVIHNSSLIQANGQIWYCSTAGVTGPVEPSFTINPTTDGTAAWTSMGSNYSIPNFVSVGGLNQSLTLATGSTDSVGNPSNYGLWVTLGAGEELTRTYGPGGGYAWWVGTSFASPLVASAAAILFANFSYITAS